MKKKVICTLFPLCEFSIEVSHVWFLMRQIMQHSKREPCTLSPIFSYWVFVEFWDMCISRQEGQGGIKKPVWAPKAHVAHLAETLTLHYIYRGWHYILL